MAPRRTIDRFELADRLHSSALHLLRRLRRVDEASGLSAPKLSALSVLVFGGPKKLGELADAEQVRPATMSRLVQDLENDGLVSRRKDESDGRVVQLRATSQAMKLLKTGRSRRVDLLASWLEDVNGAELATLHKAVEILERMESNKPG